MAIRRRPSFLRQFSGVVYVGVGLGLFWFAYQAATLLLVWSHYSATVQSCSGGRGNQCVVIVHTSRGDIPSTAKVGATHIGSQISVAANGSPPWTQDQRLSTTIAWAEILMSLAGGLVATIGGARLWYVGRGWREALRIPPGAPAG